MFSNECWLGMHDACEYHAPPLFTCDCGCHVDFEQMFVELQEYLIEEQDE